jgi:hypothetical protein
VSWHGLHEGVSQTPPRDDALARQDTDFNERIAKSASQECTAKSAPQRLHRKVPATTAPHRPRRKETALQRCLARLHLKDCIAKSASQRVPRRNHIYIARRCLAKSASPRVPRKECTPNLHRNDCSVKTASQRLHREDCLAKTATPIFDTCSSKDPSDASGDKGNATEL